MTKVLKQFKATYKDSGVASCMAVDITEAARVLSADAEEPVIIQKTADGIKVSMPDPALSFVTVSNEETCKAYPSGGSGIKLGDTLFLTAVAGEGFDFEGWYQGDTLVSSDAEAAVIVESTAQVPSVLKFEARFSAQ